jgi:MFS family permease
MRAAVLLRALSHRNYRLFFFGQGVSLIGTWMQQIAMSWLVYELTRSSFWYGLVLFCGQIPALFLSPVAGVYVDRINRHRLLLLTQSLAMLQALLLAGLDFAGVLAIWHIVALSLFIGIVNAFDITARQVFLTEIIEDRADLGNAIALNSSIVNGARLIGPALGGLVLAEVHAGGCFLVNGLSFLAVLAALAAMRLTPGPHPQAHPPMWSGLTEGFRYAFGFAPIRVLLLVLTATALAGMSSSVLLPAFNADRLHGDARTLGLLMAASGVGALLAALFLAARTTVLGLGKWIIVAPILLGFSLFGFALPPSLFLALGLLLVTGFAMMLQMAAINSLLQTIVEERLRGRVMSFYTMSFLGVAPIGSLLAGLLADRIGLVSTFLLCGAVAMLAGIAFATQLPRLRTLIRPIYRRLNILPEIATGIQSVTDLSVPPQHQTT